MPEKCLNVEFNVSPTTAVAGEAVSITTTITNCDNSRQEIGPEIYIFDGATSVMLSSEGVLLQKGQTYTKTVTFTVPADAPSGTVYTAHLRVLRQGGASFHNATFTVQ